MAGPGSSTSLDGEDDDINCSAMIYDLEALDCPICYDVLTSPIFQCENGHMACSTCCTKLRNKCPLCDLEIGHIRCRAMERVIQSVIVQCRNAKYGCKKEFLYGTESTHEKECTLSLCSCPAQDCNYTAFYNDLYNHFDIHKRHVRYNHRLLLGEIAGILFDFSKYTSVVVCQDEDRLLFMVQCFQEPHGIYVTVNFIAPSALQVGDFSCHISTALEKHTMTCEFRKVKRVTKLSFETPKEDFMLIPYYILHEREELKLMIRICRLN